ncbi:ABC transporter ATP-binding protein [Austwickia chelonae]|uniref:ABC transporter ATP-binding protein n=1 Tax=Austwickia chelonae TaxID=100225 RepID=UPI000E247B40|nr:ABC transporter ATP-binding protein [Austwickia chelonae]
MENSTDAVTVTGLYKTFRRRRETPVEAVRGVDLRIACGEIVALLGPNGAGKSTLLDMILGFARPTGGTVSVLGGSPASAAASGRVGALLQNGGLLKQLTVGDTLAMVASLYGRAGEIRSVAERAGVDGLLRRKVGSCSGGERQRVHFALALLPDPDLIVLDEPTVGLDVAARKKFWAVFRSEAERGRTVVFATHYLAEADAEARRIVLMKAGRIIADGTPAQVKATALGRTVRCTVGRDTDTHLATLPFVHSLDRRGQVLTVRTGDSDALARYLFLHCDAHDVEILPSSLDDAFLTLTGTEQ